MLVAISHHACPADDLQRRDLGQLGQEVVLNAIGKGSVFSVVAQILKRQRRDSRGRWMVNYSAVPHDHTERCYQGERQHCHRRSRWISLQPSSPLANNSDVPCFDWLVLQPAFQVFRELESRGITAFWISFETLQANGRKVAIDFRIPQTRWPRLGFQ